MYNQNQMELYQKYELDCQKEYAKAQIDVYKNKSLLEIKSDVTAQRELQRTRVIFEKSGKIWICKDNFSNNMNINLSLVVVTDVIYCPTKLLEENESENKGVLLLEIEILKKRSKLWINLMDVDEKGMKRKFLRAGIDFGFGIRKEQEMKEKFLVAAIENAEIKEVPIHHGWNQTTDGYRYVFPDELTWTEAVSNAKK